MIPIDDLELMKESYGLLYRIENLLRELISIKLEHTYGLNWFTMAPKKEKLKAYKKPFKRLYFHELIPFLVIYPCLSKNVSDEFISLLRKLIPIRNKIAHSICLSNDEYQILVTSYNHLVKILPNYYL